MSENRDLARSLLAAARRRSNRFKREQENKNQKNRSRSKNSSDTDNTETTPSENYQGPELINDSIAELVAERGWRERMKDSDLFIKWTDLVGADIADHVQIISFTQGVLTLAAESTAWATQLRLIDHQIVTALATGGFQVSELVIKGPHAPTWRKGGWSVKGGRGPRDTYG